MSALFTLVWWKAAGLRASRTAVVLAIPYLPASYAGQVPYLAIASTAILGALLSLLTSLLGIAEVKGESHPLWYSLADRVVKTVAQALIAGIGTAVLLQDVDWTSLPTIALTSGFGSLLLGLLAGLPESGSTTVVMTPAEAAAQVAASDSATATVVTPEPSGLAALGLVDEEDEGEPSAPGESTATNNAALPAA